MILYFDSSALAKRYVREAGSDRVLVLMDQAELIFASRLTWLELTSTISRRSREGTVTRGAEILRALDDDFAEVIHILDVSLEIWAHARQMVLKHSLRAADALQLATAKMTSLDRATEMTFLSSDRRLLASAASEGLTISDPAS